MSRKNTVRDNVNGVRARLPKLSDPSRNKVELAPLRDESNVTSTVDALARSRITSTTTLTSDTQARSLVQETPMEALKGRTETSNAGDTVRMSHEFSEPKSKGAVFSRRRLNARTINHAIEILPHRHQSY